MTSLFWFTLGAFIGVIAGYMLACLMIMAKGN